MAETPEFESPIVKNYDKPGRELILTDVSALSKLIVRAEVKSPTAAQINLAFGSSRELDGVLVLGQRPGEWMLVGEGGPTQSAAENLDNSGHVSVIDHTHSRAMFRLTGKQASSVLEKVCGLDWSDEMTPDGAVTSGSVAKVTCDLARHDSTGTPSYLIACDRSFGQYLFDALLDAGDEFGIGVS